jgi:enoyl-[acyl-carrier protein] reductase III
VAVDLAAHGWNVVVAYLRNDAAAEDVATAVRSHGGQALVHRLNVANSAECSELVRRMEAEARALGGFVHCAALGALSPVLATRPGWWRLAWDTHVGALVELVQQARSLLRPGAGVVALTSLGAQRVTPGYASIGAAKAALETLVRYLAVELAEAQINVNALCGGPVDTDSLRSFPFFADLQAESQRRPPGRMGRTDDLAPVVRFLLSPEARWIRGQVIVADGGFSLY